MSLKNALISDLENYYDRDDKSNKDTKLSVNVYSDSINIYYTMSIVNSIVYDPPNPARSIAKEAKLQFTRNDTILNRPSDYRVCVSRLSFPSASIPLFIFPSEEGTYTVTLSYVPNNPLLPIIQVTENVVYQNINIGDAYSNLQAVYYIQTMLNFVNDAYENAYNQIVLDVAAIGETYDVPTAPFILFNQTTKLFEFYGEITYIDNLKRGIFMNKPLFDDFFSGFYSREILGGNGFNGIQLGIQNYGNNSITIDGTDYIKMTEEFSSSPLVNKVDRIIVSSNMIPTNNTRLATQKQENIPVLLDYIIPDENSDRRRYEYKPAIYKWVDLTQQHPLRSFDVAFYILFETGEIIPLKINANQRIDMTLLFTLKGTVYQ